MLLDSILIPANPCSVVSFSVNLIILNQSDGQMVERDGKFGRYDISVEEGMGLEERMEPGWVLEVMQGQGNFSSLTGSLTTNTTSKDFLFYHIIYKSSGIYESLAEMMKVFILGK